MPHDAQVPAQKHFAAAVTNLSGAKGDMWGLMASPDSMSLIYKYGMDMCREIEMCLVNMGD